MEGELPVVTIILSVLILASYLFTASNLKSYEYLLGFVPSRPTIFSFVTYTFIHIDAAHLIGNLVMLIIAGLAIERYVGKASFLSIYIASGCIAAIFDILSRYMLGISMRLPFVGASGSIFGLVAVASLVKPMERIPTFLVILTLLPIFQLVIGLPIFSEQKVFITILIFLAAVFAIVLYTLPHFLPLFVAALIFIISWVIFLAFKLPTTASNIGHLGGLIGGFVFMFAFPREKKP